MIPVADNLFVEYRVSHAMKISLFLNFVLLSLLANTVQAVVGSKNAEKGWEAIVYITFTFKNNVDENQCSGFLINDHQAISTAHCAIRDENMEKAISASACIGKQFPFDKPGEACFSSQKLKFAADYKYSTSTDFVTIELPEAIPLNFLGIQPLKVLPDSLAKKLMKSSALKLKAQVISFGSRNFNQPSLGKKGKAKLSNLHWDKIKGLWSADVPNAVYGKADDGAGLVVKIRNSWYLAGLLVRSKPDFFVSVEPFFDPCLPAEPGAKQPGILLTSTFKFLALNTLNCKRKTVSYLSKDAELCKLSQPASIRQLLLWLKSDKSGRIAYYLSNTIKKPSKKLNYLFKAAQLNNAEAQYQLYKIYLQGNFVRQDKAKASYYLEKASKNGLPAAQYELAMHLKKGDLTFKMSKPTQWFAYIKKAARKGSALAQYQMGLYYQQKNANRSYNWIMRAARQGYAPAQFVLAQYMLEGRGTRKNAYMAKRWLEYSAGQGYLLAINKLKHVRLSIYEN